MIIAERNVKKKNKCLECWYNQKQIRLNEFFNIPLIHMNLLRSKILFWSLLISVMKLQGFVLTDNFIFFSQVHSNRSKKGGD